MRFKSGLGFLLLLIWFVSACSPEINSDITPEPALAKSIQFTVTNSVTPSVSPAKTLTPSPFPTDTPTFTPTASQTSSPSATASTTQTATPTSEFPMVTTLMQANCRYGPGVAYLYAHGLYPEDRGQVHGRNYSGTWLWIQPENLDWHCWVAASVVEVDSDVMQVNVVQTRLPKSTLYGPPDQIQATRNGDIVTIAWSPVWMTEDDYRGYLIEATVCQAGRLVPIAVHIDGTKVEITDEKGCNGSSKGILYTVEKHGYTDPVEIPWP